MRAYTCGTQQGAAILPRDVRPSVGPVGDRVTERPGARAQGVVARSGPLLPPADWTRSRRSAAVWEVGAGLRDRTDTPPTCDRGPSSDATTTWIPVPYPDCTAPPPAAATRRARPARAAPDFAAQRPTCDAVRHQPFNRVEAVAYDSGDLHRPPAQQRGRGSPMSPTVARLERGTTVTKSCVLPPWKDLSARG